MKRLAFVLVGLAFIVSAADQCRAGEKEAAAPALPRLVDLGADKCIPCKKMAPILVALRKDYAGIVQVDFIDVWKQPKAGEPYRIRVIPTQIFFDRAGKEVFRHEGFFSREDIEKVFRDKLGIEPPPPAEEKGESKQKTSGGDELSYWDPVRDEPDEPKAVARGAAPGAPPARACVVYATVSCACVMERCQRLKPLLQAILDPHGDRVTQRWVDRVAETELADSLLATWGLADLPAVVLVDAGGRPYYGDDEEIDLVAFRARLAESL
jgi:thioredoxin 1